ncbi:MAG: YfcC family protein, partial [Flavobacteriaceae bacterium]|nr:YfcC family protein [Flavobacteriaceae bacterium]
QKTNMVENVVGNLVRKMGENKKSLIVILMTYIFGLAGIAIGYENNIALVPIAAVLSLAIGGDLMLAAGISVGAITVGFGLSPINPYTVGIGHKIAGLPMFSGVLLRSVLSFVTLSIMAYYNLRYFKRIQKNKNASLTKDVDSSGLTLSKPIQDYFLSKQDYLVLIIFLAGMTMMLYGIFALHWYLNDISAIFILIAVFSGLAGRLKPFELSETILKYVGISAPGAFMVGFAAAIKILMEQAHISDTISHGLVVMLSDLPTYSASIFMSISQSAINFLIPSGSGQALATLPIMIPLGDVIGLTRQSTILAFQIGDGVTNLVNPTLGGLIAMLSMCRVSLDKWLRYIFPVAIAILLISWLFLTFSVYINWGPA